MQEIFTCNQVEKPGSCLNLPRKKWGWFGGVNHPTKIIQNLRELLYQNHPKFWWIVIYLISFPDVQCSVALFFSRRKKEGGNIPMISTDKYQQWLLDRSRMIDLIYFLLYKAWFRKLSGTPPGFCGIFLSIVEPSREVTNSVTDMMLQESDFFANDPKIWLFRYGGYSMWL